jgi:hypothetical protein
MSDQTPAPEFDAQNYSRPNQRWLCGRLVEGKPCEIGPDGRGRCQAGSECVPSLEIKQGETKGRWRCNRPGGACEAGPSPDGTCGRPIPPCAPTPTLRTLRGRFTFAVVTATAAILLILLGHPAARTTFINPGPLSRAHSAAAFGSSHTNLGSMGCVECHTASSAGPNGVVKAALAANPRPWKFRQLLLGPNDRAPRMDEACLNCHQRHDFHEANAPKSGVACSVCHVEHQGDMTAATDAECGRCHANDAIMAGAQREFLKTAAGATPGAIASAPLLTERPTGGYEKIIHHFATDHPEFRVIREKIADPDTLKFNHRLHLSSPTIRLLPEGAKLNCQVCHQPDESGAFMKPVSFRSHCAACHSLQFDPETPGLTLPHGNADFVSAFLHSLPEQYLQVARGAGVSQGAQQRKFVEEKLSALRSQSGPGEELERRVFFSSARMTAPVPAGSGKGDTHPLYPGCALCHQVTADDAGRPKITSPVQVRRWLTHGRFEHNKHTAIACIKCHATTESINTADILLPSQKVCSECHSPRGGVADSCVICHRYHNPPMTSGEVQASLRNGK